MIGAVHVANSILIKSKEENIGLTPIISYDKK